MPTRTIIKHEFEVEGLDKGSVSTITADNPAFMHGLERMFAINQWERVSAVEFVLDSANRKTVAIRAHIVIADHHKKVAKV